MSVNVKMQGESHELVEREDSGWITLWGNTSSYIKYRKINDMVNVIGFGEKSLSANGGLFEVTIPSGYRPNLNVITMGTCRSLASYIQCEMHPSGVLTITNISSSSANYFAFEMMYFVGG